MRIWEIEGRQGEVDESVHGRKENWITVCHARFLLDVLIITTREVAVFVMVAAAKVDASVMYAACEVPLCTRVR